MKPAPGKETVDRFEGLKAEREKLNAKAFSITLEHGNEGERIIIPPEDLGDINVVRDGKDPSDNFVLVTIIIKATNPLWRVKVPGNVFLSDLNR
jgi:hypothetical protein